MNIGTRRIIVLGAAAFVVAAAGSCAYYNTLYNARKLYREAEKSAATGGAAREQREKYEKVVEKCAKVIAEYPQSRWIDDAVFLMGLALVRQGEYDKGIRKFQEIITNFPESDYAPQARHQLADAYYRKEEYRQALGEVERFLADYPQHKLRFEALFLGGDIQRALGEDEAAISYYGRVADMAKDADLLDEARTRVGDLFFERGDWERAAANYELVLRKGLPWERRYRISLKLATCRARTGACEEAIRLVDQLLEKTTVVQEVPPLLLARAAGFECMDSLDAALSAYDEVIAKYPRSAFSAEAHYRTGVLFDERLDSLSAAQQAFSKVAAEFANSEFAAQALEKSTSMKRLMDFERAGGAGETRERAAEKKFMSAEIQLFTLDDTRKAIAGYTAVLDSFPQTDVAPRAAYAIAWIHQHKLENPDTAVSRYRSLVERYPRSPQVRGALYELGMLGADSLRSRLGAYADSARADTAAIEAERRAREAARAGADTSSVPPEGARTGRGADSLSAAERRRMRFAPQDSIPAATGVRPLPPRDTSGAARPIMPIDASRADTLGIRAVPAGGSPPADTAGHRREGNP